MKTNLLSSCFLVVAVLSLVHCAEQPTPHERSSNPAAPESLVQRGEYLTNALGCDDCHTPKNMTPQGPVPDMERRFMGHPTAEAFSLDDKKELIAAQHISIFSPGMTAAAGPWGASFAANLTPDDTGIGAWSEAQFIKAMREGKSKGLDNTRPLLPPMPWPSYKNLNDEDLKAVFAFLKTVKPIENVVPLPQAF
jgi:hypothetical protein